MKTSLRKRITDGFTLVEMLVVLTIILILAGFVIGGLAFVQDKQAREKAKAQVALLSKAIEDYKADMGVYPGEVDFTTDPRNQDGLASAELYEALFIHGLAFQTDPRPHPSWQEGQATEIYLGLLDPRGNKQGWIKSDLGESAENTAVITGEMEEILDPWGNPYRYRIGQNAQNPDFDVWSIGKDGKTNTGNSASGLNADENKDDIRNF